MMNAKRDGGPARQRRSRVLRALPVTLSVIVLTMCVAVSPADASSIQIFDINVGSTLPSQPYGTLTLTLSGGAITFSISLIGGNTLIETGQDASIGFDSSLSPDPTIGASSFSSTGYSLENGGVPADPTAHPRHVHMDGFGYFDYGIGSIYGANDSSAAGSLSFMITRAGGFSAVEDLIDDSDGGIASPFAFDLWCPTCLNSQTGQLGATGFVGTTPKPPSSPVPEPATLALLGAGLAAATAVSRRRRLNQR